MNDLGADTAMAKGTRGKLAFLIAGLSAIGFLYWGLVDTGVMTEAFSDGGPQRFIARLGSWGPASVVGLMAIAIVVSPLPSAPIAVAAGALYGHTYGTIYVIIGAEIGAVVSV